MVDNESEHGSGENNSDQCKVYLVKYGLGLGSGSGSRTGQGQAPSIYGLDV